MKTVSGTVLSARPVSLSKAAKTLSKFALADNGASPAVSAYLKRASESFNELVRLHKELKGPGSDRSSRKKHRSGADGVVEPVNLVENCENDAVLKHTQENDIGGKASKRKEKKANVDGSISEWMLRNREIKEEELKKEEDESKDKGNFAMKTQVLSSDGIPEAGMTDNDVEANSGKKVNLKKKKKKKDACKEEKINVAVDVSLLKHGGGDDINRQWIKSDVKQEAVGKEKNIIKTKGSDADEREIKDSKTPNLIDCQVHENDRINGIGTGEKKKHKKKQVDQGEVKDCENEVKSQQKRKKIESKKRKSEEMVDGVLDQTEQQKKFKKTKAKHEDS